MHHKASIDIVKIIYEFACTNNFQLCQNPPFSFNLTSSSDLFSNPISRSDLFSSALIAILLPCLTKK